MSTELQNVSNINTTSVDGIKENQTTENNLVAQWYEGLAQLYPDIQEFQCMNYGYVNLDENRNMKVTQTSINLYEQVLAGKPLKGKDILEVSCGRGGGAAWCVRTYQPRFYVGLDIAPTAIALCQRNHAAIQGLTFVAGNAAKTLPFTNQSFDIVLSVEATHAYQGAENIKQFAREAARILRPNGYLLWCDLCSEEEENASIECFTNTGEFVIEDKIDITKNVLRSLDIRSAETEEVLKRIAAPEKLDDYREFAGVPGTPVYESMREGRTIYWRAVFRKKSTQE